MGKVKELQRDIEAEMSDGKEGRKIRGCRKESHEEKWRFVGNLQIYKGWKTHGIQGEEILTEEWDLVKYTYLC